MAVKATPTEAAQAWQTGFTNAAPKYTAGINSVKTAPGQLAAAQKGAYVSGVQQNANIWASKVAAVSLQSWQNAATTTGAARLATGATKGEPKVQAFQAKFLPFLANTVSSLPARGEFAQNIARFQSYATALHQAKGTF